MLNGYDRDSYAERALAFLEKDICYLAQMNWGYGMDSADVEQELRMHLWNKLHLYHPGKAGLRAWAQSVMRRRLISMARMVNAKSRFPPGTVQSLDLLVETVERQFTWMPDW